MESIDEIFDDANGDLAVGDLESAVEKYRRCVQLDPDFFDGWHALGMSLMKLGRFSEASKQEKEQWNYGLTIKSAGRVSRSFTIARATLRKPKQPARKRRFFPGAGRWRKSDSNEVHKGHYGTRFCSKFLSPHFVVTVVFVVRDFVTKY